MAIDVQDIITGASLPPLNNPGTKVARGSLIKGLMMCSVYSTNYSQTLSIFPFRLMYFSRQK
jgi:hypothetical protein